MWCWALSGPPIQPPHNWPLGTLIAQGAHAATAALWRFRDDANVIAYGEDLERMHKVVLQAKDEAELATVSSSLDAAGLKHWRWVELPENVPTAIATVPYPKAQFGDVLRRLRLFK